MVERQIGDDADAAVLLLLLGAGLVGAEQVIDNLVIFVDATLHLGLMAAGEQGEGGGSEKRCGDLGGVSEDLRISGTSEALSLWRCNEAICGENFHELFCDTHRRNCAVKGGNFT